MFFLLTLLLAFFQILDVIFTIKLGLGELNPFVRPLLNLPTLFVSVKVWFAIILGVLCFKTQRKAPLIIVCFLYGVLVTVQGTLLCW